MTILAFDTYAAVTRLKEACFSEAQAKGVIDTFREVDTSDVATKSDVRELELRIRELELRMTIKLGGLIVAATGILLAAIRYLPAGHP